MKKFQLLLISFTITGLTCTAQNPFEFGAEYIKLFGTGYKGNKAGVRAETFQNKSSFSAGLLYQFSSSKSYSVSNGFSLYAGYRYAFSNTIEGNSPFIGARFIISMENFEGKTFLNSLLITPAAEAGYHFVFSDHIYTAPAIGYGYTIKLTKEYNSLSEDEGGRIMPSLSAGYRF